ncbi:hypothetical protein ACFQX7_35870 [Luedemannella flava]
MALERATTATTSPKMPHTTRAQNRLSQPSARVAGTFSRQAETSMPEPPATAGATTRSVMTATLLTAAVHNTSARILLVSSSHRRGCAETSSRISPVW